MKVIVGIFTFIKYKWYYSLILRELRWYFLLIPHYKKIQQFMKQLIVIYLQQMRAPHSAHVKQVESLKIISVDLKPPG